MACNTSVPTKGTREIPVGYTLYAKKLKQLKQKINQDEKIGFFNRGRDGLDMSREKFYMSSEGPEVKGITYSPENLTVAELMGRLKISPSKPNFKVTRYPVSAEEYAELKAKAARPKNGGKNRSFSGKGIQEDARIELTGEMLERPEYNSKFDQNLTPIMLASFQSITQTIYNPPDCSIAVGPQHVVVAANATLAIYSKTGNLLHTVDFETLFDELLLPNTKLTDTTVAYDHYADRWIFLIGSLRQMRDTPHGAWFLLAVSKTGDPRKDYWSWALDSTLNGNVPSDNWGDRPQLGFDTQAVYITCDTYPFVGGNNYPKIRILSKNELYKGSAFWHDFWNMLNPDGSICMSIQPCIHFRALSNTLVNIPAYFINALWPEGTSLTIWTLKNPLLNPILSRAQVNCMPYSLPPHARQKGFGLIDTGDCRLLNAIYQFSPSGEKRLWTCHTTANYKTTDTLPPVATIQWYEIDIKTNSIVQQGRFTGGTQRHYFCPVIHTNVSRDAFILFSSSAPEEFVQLRQTGRRSTDPLNTLNSSLLVKDSESGAGFRWGDYFGICRDPNDPRIVWMNGEYIEFGGSWGTWTCSVTY